MKKVALSFILFLFVNFNSIFSQSGGLLSECLYLKIESVYDAKAGDTLSIPVYVSDNIERSSGFFHTIKFDREYLRFIKVEESQETFKLSFSNIVEDHFKIQSFPFINSSTFRISNSIPFFMLNFIVRKELAGPVEISFLDPGSAGYILDERQIPVSIAGISGYVRPYSPSNPLRIDAFCAWPEPGDCSGRRIGYAEVNGGRGPYQYEWTVSNQSIPDSLPKIYLTQEGFYEVKVTDADSNVATAAITFPGMIPVDTTYQIAVIQPANCNELGKIVVGSESVFSFRWSDRHPQLSRVDLTPGQYQLTLRNEICEVEQTFNFSIQRPELPALLEEIEEASCEGTGGRISLNFESGVHPDSFLWVHNPALDTSVADGLDTGSYSVGVEWKSCQAEYTLEVQSSDVFGEEVAAEIDGASCNRNGKISLSFESAPAVYEIDWSNGRQGPVIDNLSSGTYQATITNTESGCSGVREFEVGLQDLRVELSQECVFEDGRFFSRVTASTSDAPFPVSFRWFNGEEEIFDFDDGPLASSTVDLSVEELYNLEVTNANTCSVILENVSVACDVVLSDTVFLTIETPMVNSELELLVPITMASRSILESVQFGIEWERADLQLKEVRSGGALNFAEGLNYEEIPENQQLRLLWNNENGSAVSSENVLCYLVFEQNKNAEGPFNFSFLPDQTDCRNIANYSLQTLEKVEIELGVNVDRYDFSQEMTLSFPTVQAFPGDIIDIPLRVSNFQAFLGMQATFTWPKDLLSFMEITESNPKLGQDLNLSVNVQKAKEEGKMATVFAVSSEISLEDEEVLFSIRFQVLGKSGLAPLNISNDFLQVEVIREPEYSGTGLGFFPLFESGSVQIFDLNAWPGDIDRNGLVNQEDWLYLGLTAGMEGPPRADRSGEWKSTPSLNWNAAFPVSRLNLKNADVNGDGSIDLRDSSVLLQNFSRKTPAFPLAFNKPVVFNKAPIIPLQFQKEVDTLLAGQKVQIPIVLDQLNELKDLFGYAFKVSYDTTWLKTNTLTFVRGENFFNAGTSTQGIMVDDSLGHFRVAVFRGKGDGMLMDKNLGYLEFELNALPKDFEVDTLSLSLSEIILMDSEERRYQATGDEFKLPIKYTITSNKQAYIDQQLNIFPVPASGTLNLSYQQGRILSVNIHSLDGRLIDSHQGQDIRQVQLPKLPTGFYHFKILTSDGMVNKLIPVIK